MFAGDLSEWVARGARAGGGTLVGFVFLALIVGAIYLFSLLLKRLFPSLTKTPVDDVFGTGLMFLGAVYCIALIAVGLGLLWMGMQKLSDSGSSFFWFYFVVGAVALAKGYWMVPPLRATYQWIIEKLKA